MKTILIAEDNESIQSILFAFLHRLAKIVQVTNGKDTVEIITDPEYNISLVLLDVNMPGIGGLEAYSLIRLTNKTLPVIFMSGSLLEEVIDIDALDDPNVYLASKPFKTEFIIKLVQDILGSAP